MPPKGIFPENAVFKLTDEIMNAVNATGISCYLAQNFYGVNVKSFQIEYILFVNHFYLPSNALNCTKLRRLKSTCINILKDNYLLKY